MRHAETDFSLVMGSDRRKILCITIDVSDRWMSICTMETLVPAVRYFLNNGANDMELRLMPQQYESDAGTYYRFQMKDNGENIGRVLYSETEDTRQRPNAPSLLNANLTINGCAVKTARFSVDTNHVVVAARTMGTRSDYHMQTRNISKSGFLLTQAGGTPAPFNVNTLIELGVAIRDGETRTNISCLAKVVRCVKEQNQAGEDTTGFGVQIIEIDPLQMRVWENYVASIDAPGPAAQAA